MASYSLHDTAMGDRLEQDHKREIDQKHKWALGEAVLTPGRHGRRPAKPPGPWLTRNLRREVEFQKNKAAQVEKISRKHDSHFNAETAVSDSSAEEDIKEASAAPEPDAGISYSYDAARGPDKGGQILGMALAKAVEKYETKATEKLVKEEYEIVRKEKEDCLGGYATDDDDYELV